jgi:hypothetical protein
MKAAICQRSESGPISHRLFRHHFALDERRLAHVGGPFGGFAQVGELGGDVGADGSLKREPSLGCRRWDGAISLSKQLTSPGAG